MGEKYEINFSTNQFGIRSFKTDINKPSKINFFVFGILLPQTHTLVMINVVFRNSK